MANAEWRMPNAEWRMANGEWRMAKSIADSRQPEAKALKPIRKTGTVPVS
jgi:hypothetical protein